MGQSEIPTSTRCQVKARNQEVRTRRKAQYAPIWHPGCSEMARRKPKMGPRWTQVETKTVQQRPRWPKMVPFGPQGGPRRPQAGPKMPHDAPKMATRSPRWPREGPKMPQHGPKRGSRTQDGQNYYVKAHFATLRCHFCDNSTQKHNFIHGCYHITVQTYSQCSRFCDTSHAKSQLYKLLLPYYCSILQPMLPFLRHLSRKITTL